MFTTSSSEMYGRDWYFIFDSDGHVVIVDGVYKYASQAEAELVIADMVDNPYPDAREWV